MNQELIEAATTEIEEYSKTEAGLADLRARMANVEYDVITVKGMAIARADRAEVRGLRTGLEAMRKQIKAPALAHCHLIDAEAKRITAALLELEEPIDKQIKAREAALEAERVARELAERNRITAIHQRIADIRNFHALALECRTADRVQALVDKLGNDPMENFEEFEIEAKSARIEVMERMEKIIDQKREAETETARIQAEQAAAAAQLVKDRAELAAQQAAARLEQKRLDDEANARRAAEQKVIDERNTKEAAEMATARKALAVQAKQVADAQAVIDEAARKAKEADDLAAYLAAVVPVVDAPCVTYTTADFEAGHASDIEDQHPSVAIETPAPTSAEIYCMCCESDTSDQFARWLCAAAGVSFPPVNESIGTPAAC